MVNKAVKEKTLIATEISRDKMKTSHLQYVDDTIFIAYAILNNAWAMTSMLMDFELASGLKVNFSKSSLTGINVGSSFLMQMANVLQCEIGSIFFSLFGNPSWDLPQKNSGMRSSGA